MLDTTIHKDMSTLVWGTSNPKGVEHEQSIYLTKTDIKDMIEQVEEANKKGEYIPVKLEHKGIDLGRVVTAWEHNGELQCLLEINENKLEGSFGAEFVREGIVKDLSLGYDVCLQHTKNKTVTVRRKLLKEVSIVKRGFQKKCHIHSACKYK